MTGNKIVDKITKNSPQNDLGTDSQAKGTWIEILIYINIYI